MGNGFTAQANDDDTPHIGVAGKAGEDLLAHIRIGLNIGAAGVEYDVHSPLHLAGNDPGGFAATGAGGQNQDVVTDTGTALRSAVAPELHAGLGLYRLRQSFVLCLYHLAVIVSGDTEQIVMGDPAALGNVTADHAKAFAVFDDVAALGNVHKGDLVAVGDVLLSGQAANLLPIAVGDGLTGGDIGDHGDHVVLGVH